MFAKSVQNLLLLDSVHLGDGEPLKTLVSRVQIFIGFWPGCPFSKNRDFKILFTSPLLQVEADGQNQNHDRKESDCAEEQEPRSRDHSSESEFLAS